MGPRRWFRAGSADLPTLRTPDGWVIRYALRLPPDLTTPRPLVVSLHYRWETRGAAPIGFGAAMLDELVAPALAPLGAIFVAPDNPVLEWVEPVSERAVLALVREIRRRYPVDPNRIVVTGFSLGAAGCWHLIERHPDVFSAAVVVAGSPPNGIVERLEVEPVFAVNSRADTAASLPATAEAIASLQRRGVDARLVILETATHLERPLFAEAMTGAVSWLESIWDAAERSGATPTRQAARITRPTRPQQAFNAFDRKARVADVWPTLSDTERLCVLCARTRLEREGEAQIAELAAHVTSWDELFGLADRHGMGPLLYWHLNRVAREFVPPRVLAGRRDAFAETYLRSGLLTSELIRLDVLFKQHGVAAIPFKGPLLAVAVYSDLALRRSGDLDFVVHAGDIPRASQLLRAEGYRATDGRSDQSADPYHIFVHDDLNVTIDLQSGIGAAGFLFSLDQADRWRSLEPVALGSATVHTFATADLLLVLSVHGAKHCWSRLMWLTDVAELLRAREGADWAGILEHARASGAGRMVGIALALTRDLLGCQLPDRVLDAAADEAETHALAAALARVVFADPPLTEWERMRLYFAMKERWSDRLRFLLHCSGMDLDFDLRASAPVAVLASHYLLTCTRRIVKHAVPPRTRAAILRWCEKV